MSPDAALLLVSVTTAFVFISAQSTCRNTVHCLCGSTAETFTICAEQNTTTADPCTRWAGCKSCEGGSEEHSCFKAMNQTLRSRRKRQYASYGREGRRSRNFTRSARQSEENQSCGDPGFLTNGFRRDSNGTESRSRRTFQEGESLVFGCRSNEYGLQGSSKITCRNGEWSEALPKCIKGNVVAVKQTCGDPGFLTNGIRRDSSGTESRSRRTFQEGESLEFGCRSNEYTLQGSSSMICRDGVWSEPLPTCIKRNVVTEKQETCGDPGFFANGFRRDSNGTESRIRRTFQEGESLEFGCRSNEYALQGSSKMTCRNGEWSEALPKCIKSSSEGEFCLNPESIENGKITYYPSMNSQSGSEVSLDDSEYPPNSRLVYSCNEGYRLQGASQMTCQGDTGVWSTDLPTCVRALTWNMMYCDNQGPIINGRVEYFPPPMYPRPISDSDIEYPEGTRLQYSCAEGFDLIGTPNVSCLSTSQWSAKQPICSTECGHSFASSTHKIFNGTVSLAGEWPWVVSIREDSESEIICGGAVLNSRTVVTAAHCLTDESKSYILYFGKIRKLDKDDDDKVVKRMSTQLFIYPYYSEETTDSDIALIHFSEPIQFTDRIHPICLPDAFTTIRNLRPGSRGFVAGFGENERGRQPDTLMKASLPVQDSDVCQRYFEEEGITMTMTQNMICAGYTNAEQATCEGDSGSAFVFLNRTTGIFTLEGLVSFSTNGQCGMYGKYTVFTKVFQYVPWLLENLAQ